MSDTPNDTVVKCICCKDDTPESTAQTDTDVGGPVCPECRTNLRWAQAHLKEAGIKGCVKD